MKIGKKGLGNEGKEKRGKGLRREGEDDESPDMLTGVERSRGEGQGERKGM